MKNKNLTNPENLNELPENLKKDAYSKNQSNQYGKNDWSEEESYSEELNVSNKAGKRASEDFEESDTTTKAYRESDRSKKNIDQE